jgi:beta-galactosidase
LFVPGCLLKKGQNEIIVFDLDNPTERSIAGIDHAILDVTAKDGSQLNRKPGQTLELSAWTPVMQDTLADGTGWKTVSFGKTVAGRFFCLEVLRGQKANDPVACLAEMELTGEDGKALNTLKWKILYADSEEVNKANNTADKLYDLQESIPWQTDISGDKPGYPHQVVIDLGEVVKITGIRLLPRTDKSSIGNVKEYRVYLENVTPKF